MELKESYYLLTPEIILEAVESAGLEPTGHILQLNSLENRVFSLYLEDGTSVVLKIYRPGRWSTAQIQEEHDFLFDLQEAEIPVCVPLRFDGRSVLNFKGFSFAIWPKTGGRIPDEFTDDDLALIGRLMARIHTTGKKKQSETRLTLNSETYARQPLNVLISSGMIPGNYLPRFEKAALSIADAYDRLSTGVPTHRIHGDCHWGNLLKRDSNFFFLDFDDFVTGPAVQDFWMLAPDSDIYSIQKREILIESYSEMAPFDRSWLSLIPALKGLRFINYCAWIAKRFDDPAFKQAFPNFGALDYWEKEVIDLEAIERDLNQDKNTDGEKLLSDSDYFYDM